MNYDLKRKNANGKWWIYGTIKKNKFGNFQASFKISALKDLIELAKEENKEWVNLSLYKEKDVGEKQAEPKRNTNYVALEPKFDLDDEVPFN